MAKTKLNYRFHDPNPEGVFADYLLEELIIANQKKVDAALQAAVHSVDGIADTEELCLAEP